MITLCGSGVPTTIKQCVFGMKRANVKRGEDIQMVKSGKDTTARLV